MFSSNPTGFFLSQGQPLPSEDQLTSPLKFESPVKRVAAQAKRSLFAELEEEPMEVEDPFQAEAYAAISKLVSYSPSLKMQIDVMEMHMNRKGMTKFQKMSIYIVIHKILNHPTLSETGKLVELGLFYYNLSREQGGDQERRGSFLEARVCEIESEIKALQIPESCVLGEDGKQLPTGRSAYLIRAMVKMIFPADGGFNLGGCYAVNALLKTRMGALMSEEMRAHIPKIVNRFIHDLPFREQFNNLSVHPSMAELVCIDGMMPLKEKNNMNVIYARWCVASALFTLIGQTAEINCYAVAKLMTLQSEHPEVLVTMMCDILRQGVVYYEKSWIPIAPLLESRKSYEPDFCVPMTAKKARDLPCYAITRSALQLNSSFKNVGAKQIKTLGTWMEFDFNKNAPLAKQFFLSLKFSFLQQAILAILQADAVNSAEKLFGDDSFKVKFINGLVRQMCKSVEPCLAIYIHNDPNLQAFIDQFSISLQAACFCIDYKSWGYSVEGNTVMFEHHTQGLVFNDDLDEYEPCKNIRRLFHASLHDGTFKPVDTLTDFAKVCQDHLDEVAVDMDFAYLSDFQELLRRYLKGDHFLNDLAKLVDTANENEVNFGWEDYKESNSLFLVQDGGPSPRIGALKSVTNKFSTIYNVVGLDVNHYFINLCKYFYFFASRKGEREIGSFVLGATFDHVFNFLPHQFKSFWQDPIAEMQKKMITPGVTLLHKPLSRQKMLRILSLTLGPEQGEKILKDLPAQSMHIPDFQRWVYGNLKEDRIKQFNLNLKNVLQEIDFSSLCHELFYILQAQDIYLNPAEAEQVIKCIECQEMAYLNSYDAAGLIQQALATCSIMIARRGLEEAICDRFGLPHIVEIANLDWVEYDHDHLVYTYLVLMYDVVKRTISLGQRCKGKLEHVSDEDVAVYLKLTQLFLDK